MRLKNIEIEKKKKRDAIVDDFINNIPVSIHYMTRFLIMSTDDDRTALCVVSHLLFLPLSSIKLLLCVCVQ